jgi:hypothetical protein
VRAIALGAIETPLGAIETPRFSMIVSTADRMTSRRARARPRARRASSAGDSPTGVNFLSGYRPSTAFMSDIRTFRTAIKYRAGPPRHDQALSQDAMVEPNPAPERRLYRAYEANPWIARRAPAGVGGLGWRDPFPPKHASWRNMLEIEIGVVVRQCLDRRIPDKATLVSEISKWERRRNREGARINWLFTG